MEEDCIVVRTSCCKHIIFAGVNKPDVIDLKTKREIAEMVMEGCTVEHMKAAEVRAAEWGCECNKGGN